MRSYLRWLRHHLYWLPSYIFVRLPFFEYFYAKNLRQLNDVLRNSPLDGHYFVSDGLVLGNARSGLPIPWDLDADFTVYEKDWDRLLRSIPQIVAAGFRKHRIWIDNSARVVEITFWKQGAKFEFFCAFPRAKDYIRYSFHPDRELLLVYATPLHGLVRRNFLDREWFFPDNCESYLKNQYGDDWNVPRSDWNYTKDCTNIVATEKWIGLPILGWK